MQEYRAQNMKALWVYLQPSQLGLGPILDQLSFRMHHTSGGELAMNLWLQKETKSMIPDYCSYYLAAGAVLINRKSEVLLG